MPDTIQDHCRRLVIARVSNQNKDPIKLKSFLKRHGFGTVPIKTVRYDIQYVQDCPPSIIIHELDSAALSISQKYH